MCILAFNINSHLYGIGSDKSQFVHHYMLLLKARVHYSCKNFERGMTLFTFLMKCFLRSTLSCMDITFFF